VIINRKQINNISVILSSALLCNIIIIIYRYNIIINSEIQGEIIIPILIIEQYFIFICYFITLMVTHKRFEIILHISNTQFIWTRDKPWNFKNDNPIFHRPKFPNKDYT